MSLGIWWAVIAIVLSETILFGVGAISPFSKRAGLLIVAIALILAAVLALLFVQSPDAPHVNDWIYEQFNKMLGE
jgi:hypothetical protein